jgi:hypothetical protein
VSNEPYARHAELFERPAEEEAADPRVRFRRHLTAVATRVADLAWYLEQSAPRFKEAEVRLAVEELIDHLGRLMGFDVRRYPEENCAVWALDARSRLLVRPVDADEANVRLGALVLARDALAAAGALDDPRAIACVAVVCGDLRSVRAPDAAVLLGRMMGQVRLVTLDALVVLGRACEGRALSPADAVELLQPVDPFADRLIALAARLARD